MLDMVLSENKCLGLRNDKMESFTNRFAGLKATMTASIGRVARLEAFRRVNRDGVARLEAFHRVGRATACQLWDKQ